MTGAPVVVPAAGSPRPRRRRWGRRLFYLLLLAAGARLLLPFLLPWLLDLGLAPLGLRGTFRGVSLSLLGLHVRVQELAVFPRTAAATAKASAAVLRATDLEADLDTWALLRGRFVVDTVVVAGLEVQVARRSDGSLDLPPELRGEPTAVAAPPAAATAPVAATEAPLDFRLPVAVRSLRIEGARLLLTDPALPPPHQLELRLDGDVHEFGFDDRDGQLSLRATSPQALDLLRIDASAAFGEQGIRLDWHLAVRGLQPGAVAPYLQPAGIEAAAQRLAADLGGKVELSRADSPRAARATLTASAKLTADGDETFALDRGELALDQGTPAHGGTARVAIDGVRGSATRRKDGSMAVGGLLFRAPTTSPAPPSTPPPAAAGTDFTLQSLTASLREFAFRYRDEGEAALDLEARLPSLTLGPSAWPPAGAPAPFGVELELPGIAERIRVQNGQLTLGKAGQHIAATLAAEGITLARLRDRLSGLGIEGEPQGASVGLHLDVEVATAGTVTTVQANLSDFAVRNGEAAVQLPAVHVRDLAIDDAARRLQVASVAITGPELALRREPDGAFGLLGLRWRPRAATAPAADAPTKPPEPEAAPAPAWQLALDHLQWNGARLAFTDAAVTPPQSLTVQDVAVDLAQLRLGGPPASAPATVHVRVRVPGLIDEVRIDASAPPDAAGLAVAGTVAADGLHAPQLAPWLQPLGIEPMLAQGSIAGALELRVHRDDAGRVHLDAGLRDLAVRDGEARLAAFARVAVADLLLGGDLRIGSVEITEPSLEVVREPDGAITALGLRFRGSPGGAPAQAAPAPLPGATEPGAGPTATLDRFVLTGASLRFLDQQHERLPPLDLRCDASIEHLQAGRGSAPFPFHLSLRVVTGVDEFALTGTARLDPQQIEVAAEVAGKGLRAGPLTALLPPHVKVTLTDGSVAARLDARCGRTEGGGIALFAELRDLVLRDGTAELLAIDALRADLPAITSDPPSVEVRELRLVGTRAQVRQLPDAIAVAGLTIGRPEPSPPAPPVSAATTNSLTLPHLRIDALDLDVGDLVFVDDTAGASAEPLRLHARLRTTRPWQTDQDELERSPSLPIEVSVQVLPLCAGAVLTVDLQPFALAPHVDAALHVQGIDTEALTRVWPRLAERLQGTTRTGELTARLTADLDLRRRDPAQFDLGRPISGEVQLHDLAFRAAPGGEVLAGIAAIDTELRAVNLATGDVLLRSLEISTPSLHARNTAAGLHALGLLFPAAPASAESAPGQAATRVAEPIAPAPATRAPTDSAAEFAIDTLLVNGLDVRLRDETTDPPTDLPFDSLEVEVKNLGTRAHREAVPIRFEAFLRGGEIDLPERRISGSLLGMFASATKALTGAEVKMERRPICDEMALQGSLLLFPVPTGQVRFGVSRFELLSLRALARAGKVEIGDGLLDAGVQLDMRGGNTAVTSNFVFQYLSLSEPPGGPISTYLRLPAPLDTVLFTLRDDQGHHRIPLEFTIEQGKVSEEEINANIVEALGTVLGSALSRAAFRATGWVTGLFGFGGGGAEDLTKFQQIVSFAPGETVLPLDLAALDTILDRFAGDDGLALVLTHEVGPGDAERCRALANPDLALLPPLVLRLRQEHAERSAARAREAATASALFQAGQTQRALEASARLRTLDGDLAATATALDGVLQQLRPGAERSAGKRTRAACLEVARLRLQALRALVAARVGAAAPRIEVRPPRFQLQGEGGGRIGLALRRRAAT